MDNKTVFTTKFVIEDRSEIIYVAHDKDGDWQFFSKEEASEQEARIVFMNEILDLDTSLKEILWIPEGTEAWREGVGKKWTTKVYSG
jgi:hypothetical protein